MGRLKHSDNGKGGVKREKRRALSCVHLRKKLCRVTITEQGERSLKRIETRQPDKGGWKTEEGVRTLQTVQALPLRGERVPTGIVKERGYRFGAIHLLRDCPPGRFSIGPEGEVQTLTLNIADVGHIRRRRGANF